MLRLTAKDKERRANKLDETIENGKQRNLERHALETVHHIAVSTSATSVKGQLARAVLGKPPAEVLQVYNQICAMKKKKADEQNQAQRLRDLGRTPTEPLPKNFVRDALANDVPTDMIRAQKNREVYVADDPTGKHKKGDIVRGEKVISAAHQVIQSSNDPEMNALNARLKNLKAKRTNIDHNRYIREFYDEYSNNPEDVSSEKFADYMLRLDKKNREANANYSMSYYRKRVNALKNLHTTVHQEPLKEKGKSYAKLNQYLTTKSKEIEQYRKRAAREKAKKSGSMGYTTAQFKRMMEVIWDSGCPDDFDELTGEDGSVDFEPVEPTEHQKRKMHDQNMKMFHKAIKSKTSFATDLVEFLLGDAALLRDSTKRCLELNDFELVLIPRRKAHLTEIKCLSFFRVQDKINYRGELRSSYVTRHKDPFLCAVGAFAALLFVRYQEHEPKSLNELLLDYTYTTSIRRIQTVAKRIGASFCKIGHLFRISNARRAELAGVQSVSIARAGGWSQGSMKGTRRS